MHRMFGVVVVVAALGLVAVGCGKPSCKKAVEHSNSILAKDAQKLQGEARTAALKAIVASKAAALARCKAGDPSKLTKKKYKCIMAAKTKDALMKCE